MLGFQKIDAYTGIEGIAADFILVNMAHLITNHLIQRPGMHF
jgi:hypothetical protein